MFLCVAEQKLSARPTARRQPKKGFRWMTQMRNGQSRAEKIKKTGPLKAAFKHRPNIYLCHIVHGFFAAFQVGQCFCSINLPWC